MQVRSINAKSAPAAEGSYSQAIDLRSFDRLLFISGQVPETDQGEVPVGFDDQCQLVWQNVSAQLSEAGMGLSNLVKVTTYLSHPSQREVQSRIRNEVLGDHKPALTVVICQIYATKWLLEIEAIAAA